MLSEQEEKKAFEFAEEACALCKRRLANLQAVI